MHWPGETLVRIATKTAGELISHGLHATRRTRGKRSLWPHSDSSSSHIIYPDGLSPSRTLNCGMPRVIPQRSGKGALS